MKGRNFLKIAILMLGMTMSTACSNDDNIGGEETPPTSNTNTTATTSIKSTTLTAGVGLIEGTTWVHEDFSRRYGLTLYEGNILVLSQQRKSGQWAFERNDYQNAGSGIVDVKEVGKIGNITLKSSIGNGHYTFSIYSYCLGMNLPFYPNHGYATCFVTGDGETKYMRIFAKGYTLDKQGALATITLQYQLY